MNEQVPNGSCSVVMYCFNNLGETTIPLLLGTTMILILVTGIVLDLGYVFVAINRCHTALDLSAKAAAKQIDWDEYTRTGKIHINEDQAYEKLCHLLRKNLGLDADFCPDKNSIAAGQVAVAFDMIERRFPVRAEEGEMVPGLRVLIKVPIRLHFLAFIRSKITIPVRVTVVTINSQS